MRKSEEGTSLGKLKFINKDNIKRVVKNWMKGCVVDCCKLVTGPMWSVVNTVANIWVS
jgi:hypothetical protein